MNEIKTIIFDLDGVLWKLSFRELASFIAKDLKIPEELKESFIEDIRNVVRILLHKTDSLITKEVVLESIQEGITNLNNYSVSIEDIYNCFIKEEYNYCHNNEEALPVIKELHNRGYNLVVKTNWLETVQKENLKRYGYYPFFTKVLGSLNDYLKPNPLSLKKIIGEENINHFIIIGDSLRNEIQLANHLGMKSIWLNENREEKPTEDNMIPTYEIHDIKELLNIL